MSEKPPWNQAVAAFGPHRLLAFNKCRHRGKPLGAIADVKRRDDWDRIVSSICRSFPVVGIEVCGAIMLQAGRAGAIVNNLVECGRDRAHINGKGGPMPLTKLVSLASPKLCCARFGPSNIRVNAICPGIIDTPMESNVVAAGAPDGVLQA